MTEVLKVQQRAEQGKHHARRLRKQGDIPAVLYGQGREVVSLTVGRDALRATVRHGGKLVMLDGGARGSALIQHLQWDPFGHDVLHVDFLRIAADQEIQVTVQVLLRGDAVGINEGGIVEQVTREVELEVLANAIPDRLHVNINGLGVGQSLTVEQIEDLPEGAKLLCDAGTVVVQCVLPVEEVEEVSLGESVEPELIGGKSQDDEAGEG
jgi:large subunit ribosomal protein L25